MAADLGRAAAFCCSSVDSDVLANHIVVANLDSGLFAFVRQVLRLNTNGAKREKPVVGTNFRLAMDHHMRHQLAVFAKFHARIHNAIRPNGTGLWDNSSGINDCGGMDHSLASAVESEVDCPRLMGTSCALTIPSQTSLPFTNAFPPMRTAMREATALQLSVSTSIRSWSPGTTGRRNLAFSIPVNTINLPSRSSTSVSSIAPPAWAMASMISTPGMMG